MKQLLAFCFLLIFCGCSGEKIDGKPMTIGLRPVQDFYADFVYQEVSNEYLSAGMSGMSIGIVFFKKFGEQTFLLFETKKKLGPIDGNWSVEGRKIILRSNGIIIAEGEGSQLPGRSPMIDLQLNKYEFLISTKVTIQKTYLGLDDLIVAAVDPGFIFRNENNTASGKCFMGEDPSGELSILVRLFNLEDEDPSDPDDGNGKTFELINIKNRARPVLYQNGTWNFNQNQLSLKFLDGKEFGTGEFHAFLGQEQPVVRIKTQPFALVSTAKEFNLFLMPKENCSR